jgi:4-nitrophenyl phosphatase
VSVATDEVLERLRNACGFIFDMDGTLALGDRVNHGLRPLPGAVDMLAWVRDRQLPYMVFTNGTNRSPRHFASVLREAGLDVPDSRMMTPATSAVVMFTKRGRTPTTTCRHGSSRICTCAGLTSCCRCAGKTQVR